MIIQLFRIEYTPDNINDYAVNILAESGEVAIKKIVEIVKRPITVRTIDTVCSGIQIATEHVQETIANPILKTLKNQLKVLQDQYDELLEHIQEQEKSTKTHTYYCPYCDFSCTSTLGIASHKRHKHPTEWQQEKLQKEKEYE